MVSLGAILGVNTRYIIYKKLQEKNVRINFIILAINTLATFLLGFLMAILKQISSLEFSNQFELFLLIGFLGSLSTFSTFLYDLYDLFMQCKFTTAIKLFILSLASGLIALSFGFWLGN